jgi:hypothetical protein
MRSARALAVEYGTEVDKANTFALLKLLANLYSHSLALAGHVNTSAEGVYFFLGICLFLQRVHPTAIFSNLSYMAARPSQLYLSNHMGAVHIQLTLQRVFLRNC